MTHRFPIKEIALQAGLGTATVDRALNNRAHVSPQTKLRVAAAIRELEAQEGQLAASGRRMFFDFVIEAPNRFSREVRQATEAVLPEIGSAACRPRFLTQEVMTEDEVISALTRIAKRGSQGVCLKARDIPAIQKSVNGLSRAGIPVVTLVTDIPQSSRIAYVGLDNASAGSTAAYLMAHSLPDGYGTVLVSQSHNCFWGEEERARFFAKTLARYRPNLKVVSVSGGSGLPNETGQRVEQVVGALEKFVAVYSIGGGNNAILNTLSRHGLKPELYIAHDLDRENRELLTAGKLTFVLHHDLHEDLRRAFRTFLRHHRLMPQKSDLHASAIQIVTPENIPIDSQTTRGSYFGAN